MFIIRTQCKVNVYCGIRHLSVLRLWIKQAVSFITIIQYHRKTYYWQLLYSLKTKNIPLLWTWFFYLKNNIFFLLAKVGLSWIKLPVYLIIWSVLTKGPQQIVETGPQGMSYTDQKGPYSRNWVLCFWNIIRGIFVNQSRYSGAW